PTREVPVECGRVITQPEIVRYRPEQMRRLFGPALHSQIDLRDRAVPVAFEKSGQPLLEPGRERSGTVLRRELGGRPRAQSIARRRVLARRVRDLPEREVHLRRGVVRKTAKDGLQLARSRAPADHAARERVAQNAGDHDADQAGKKPRWEGEDELLVGVEPLGGSFRKANARNSSI